MSWVLLSLRKKELKRTHAEYVSRDLQISREERQMARRYQYEQTCVQNEQSTEQRDLRTQYTDKRSSLYDQIEALRKEIDAQEGDNKIGSSDYRNSNGYTINDLYKQIDDLKEDFNESVNLSKTYWEDELAMIEEEANDAETILEEEKVNIETQMEAISQELEAVSQAISQEIQSNAIKLS